MKKWSFCMSNIALNKALYACFERLPSRGLYGKEKCWGFVSLFTASSFCALLCTFQSETGRVANKELFFCISKGLHHSSHSSDAFTFLYAESSTEHWQSKKFLQQVTVISWSNIYSSEYDLSLDIFIFDDSMQVSVKVNHQLSTYILFHSLYVHSFLYLWQPAGSRYVRWYLSSVFSVLSHPHFFICCWNLSGHHKLE